jgi:hypothetical protein
MKTATGEHSALYSSPNGTNRYSSGRPQNECAEQLAEHGLLLALPSTDLTRLMPALERVSCEYRFRITLFTRSLLR